MKPLVNAPLIREHALARGMQFGYVFNEGAGLRLNDVTGRYPATLTNFNFTSSSGWSGSPSGGGVRFDGSNDYAQILGRQILNGRRNATVAARVKVFGAFSALQFIYSENISAGVVLGLYITTSAQFGVYVFNGADNICLSSTNAVAGREYDIVGEWNVAQPALRIYVNGVLENTLTSWDGTFFSGINSVRIGGSTNVGSYPLNGILSHVYAYETLLGLNGAKALRADPYQMFDRSPASGIWVPAAQLTVAPGSTLTSTASLIAGNAAGAATGDGAQITSTASVLAGAAAGAGTADGSTISVQASFIPGVATASSASRPAGMVGRRPLRLVTPIAPARWDATAPGATFTVSTALVAGVAVASAQAPGARITAGGELRAGIPVVNNFARARALQRDDGALGLI